MLGWLAGKRSARTRRAYGRDIAAWFDWCDRRDMDPLTAAEPDVAGWARRMEADGLATSSVGRKLSAVSSGYSWLARSGHSARNPCEYLARPEVDRDTSTTPGLTRDQALAMLQAADHDNGAQRTRTSALIAVILFTGARVGEVTSADVEDLGTDRGHRVLWVTRKGGKRQPLGLPAPAADRLDANLTERSDMASVLELPGQPGAPKPRRPLFATETGARLFPSDVWKLVRRLGAGARLPADLVCRLGPHAMRHSFATLYLDAGRIAARPAGRDGPRRPADHAPL